MTSYSPAARNQVVDSLGINGGANYFSLHTDDPGTTGLNELAGCPRQLTSYPAAAAGEAICTPVTFDVPAASTIKFFGRWSALTGGVFLLGGPLPADEVYGVQGQYELTNKIVQGAS